MSIPASAFSAQNSNNDSKKWLVVTRKEECGRFVGDYEEAKRQERERRKGREGKGQGLTIVVDSKIVAFPSVELHPHVRRIRNRLLRLRQSLEPGHLDGVVDRPSEPVPVRDQAG